MRDVIHWIDTQDKEEATILAILDDHGADDAAYAYHASIGREARTKSNIYTTAETLLAAYADPVVLDSANHSDITSERLFDGAPNTLYLAAPAHEQQRLQPLFSTLIQELVAAAYERASQTAKALDPPLLLVLDECANIAPLRDLATLASTGAGQGIQLVTVFQDLAQVETTYGRSTAATIVSNHRAKLILSGIADPTTLDYTAAPPRRRRDRAAIRHPRLSGRQVDHRIEDVPRPRPEPRVAADEAGWGHPRLRPPTTGTNPTQAVVRQPHPPLVG